MYTRNIRISHSISMSFKYVIEINISNNFFSLRVYKRCSASVFNIFAKEDCCYLLLGIFVSATMCSSR